MIRLLLLVAMLSVSVSCSYFRADNDSQRITVSLSADSDINPNVDGEPSPLRIALYSLPEAGFPADSNYFDLTGQQSALREQGIVTLYDRVLKPGETRQLSLRIPDKVSAIGVTAGYREIEHSRWRSRWLLVSPGSPGLWQSLRRTKHHSLSVQIRKSEVIIGETE